MSGNRHVLMALRVMIILIGGEASQVPVMGPLTM